MDIREIATLSRTDLDKLVPRVGNTPLQPVGLVIRGALRTVYLKLESANPTGSMKDRTGYALIRSLEEKGAVTGRSMIVESTSGNLGVALALLCKAKGYRFLAVVDPKATRENLERISLLGAEIELVDQPDETGGYLLSRLARVRELCEKSPLSVWTDQYTNPANPSIHYTTTGPEIYQQLEGSVGVIFVPVSTGGTLAGIARFFRCTSPSTRIIGVDAYGSVIFGPAAGPRKLTGIGSSQPSSFLVPDLYDAYMLIKDEEAFAFCRALHDEADLKVGGSSGATLAACAKYLEAHPEVERAVCICADNGENYTSSIFSDAWLQQQQLQLSQDHLGPVEEIVTFPFQRS